MTDDDLERAVAAAQKAGLQKPEEIADFVRQWLAPMVHVEVPRPPTRDQASKLAAVRVMIARPTGAVH